MSPGMTIKKEKMHYCPGCGHTLVHKIMGEVIDELGIREKTIGSAPVGCAVLFYNYINVDMVECSHGRVPSVMSSIKRCLPDKFVFAYQGDGDLAAIGTNETIHTANRGENITVIFVNNAIYGMTGGQMAPTTLPNQVTSTTPSGRGNNSEGMPLKMCEMLSTLDGPAYIERVSVHDADGYKKTKEALMKAFKCQIEGNGYSFVEILSMCPTGWKTDIKKGLEFVDDMKKYFPLKTFKDVRKER